MNIQGHKNPDAYIVNEDIIIEFKQNERATQSAIANEIRDAKKQADYILIHASEFISAKDLLAGIKSKYRRKEPEYLKMKDLWLIWKGELFILRDRKLSTERLIIKYDEVSRRTAIPQRGSGISP